MAHFLGQTFTEAMRQKIRADVTEIMNTAIDEGQAMMCPFCCENVGTSFCPQTEEAIAKIDYSVDVCRQCCLNGGFLI